MLAAGSSQRLGRAKQLLSYRGVPLVRHIAEVVLAMPCHSAAIVLGCRAPAIASALDGLRIERLNNSAWSEGVAASIRVAAAWATERGMDGLLLTACDQVRLSTQHLAQLIEHFEDSSDIIASHYAGNAGIPALFGEAWYPRLLELRGDRGARSVVRSYARTRLIEWPDGELDVDTEQDVARMATLRAGHATS